MILPIMILRKNMRILIFIFFVDTILILFFIIVNYQCFGYNWYRVFIFTTGFNDYVVAIIIVVIIRSVFIVLLIFFCFFIITFVTFINNFIINAVAVLVIINAVLILLVIMLCETLLMLLYCSYL